VDLAISFVREKYIFGKYLFSNQSWRDLISLLNEREFQKEQQIQNKAN
jgi:hypothetical protein